MTDFAEAAAKYGWSWDLYVKLREQYASVLENEFHVQLTDTGIATKSLDASAMSAQHFGGKVQVSQGGTASNTQNAHDDEDEDFIPIGTLRSLTTNSGPSIPATKQPVNRPLSKRYVEDDAKESSDEEHSGDEDEKDQNDYDYDDGFLVGDDDEESGGEDDDDDEDDDHDEDVCSDTHDSDVDDVVIAATPKAARPPVAPASTTKGKAATVPVPFNLSDHHRCAACTSGGHGKGSGGCEYANLKDGDKDPRTGRVIIREEFDKGNSMVSSTPAKSSRAAMASPGPAGRGANGHLPPTPGGSSGVIRYAFRNKAQRDSLTMALKAEYNRTVFGNALPADLLVEWSARLTKTAGMTYTTSVQDPHGPAGQRLYSARISLSVKVLDSPYKLAQTLLHEMCHAAAWLVDHTIRPPHGQVFQKWARKASVAYPKRAVTVCHNYEIQHKFRYECQNEACGYIYGRHSKSIDTATQRCGMCQGKGALVLLAAVRADGTPAKTPLQPRKQSEYQQFMAQERKAVAISMPGAPPAVIMSEVARRWQARKASGAGAGASGGGSSSSHAAALSSGNLGSAMKAARSGINASAVDIDLTAESPRAAPRVTGRTAGVAGGRPGLAVQDVEEVDDEQEEGGDGDGDGDVIELDKSMQGLDLSMVSVRSKRAGGRGSDGAQHEATGRPPSGRLSAASSTSAGSAVPGRDSVGSTAGFDPRHASRARPSAAITIEDDEDEDDTGHGVASAGTPESPAHSPSDGTANAEESGGTFSGVLRRLSSAIRLSLGGSE